jgi:hypothetical protein
MINFTHPKPWLQMALVCLNKNTLGVSAGNLAMVDLLSPLFV